MTQEELQTLTNHELDEHIAVHIRQWHKDRYNWCDEHGVMMARSIEYIHEWSSDPHEAVYHPSSNLEWAFELMDYVMQSGWTFNIGCWRDMTQVVICKKHSSKIFASISHKERCRAIAEACVLAHQEANKEEPMFA